MPKSILALYRQRVESELSRRLAERNGIDPSLHQAMHYSLMNGGKRLRPSLVYLANELLGGQIEQADAAACALECVHSYSLVHDDLPAMDNDELRRGKPTCHIQFNEATAILAGDALLTWAFELLSQPIDALPASTQLQMVHTLARCSGDLGMVDGQAFDLSSEGKTLSLEQLKSMHAAKTGELIRAALRLGALASGNATDADLEALDRYALKIGLAFQIQDDILDIESTTEQLGKPQGSDEERDKATYPALVGLAQSKQWLHELHQEAIEALEPFGSRNQSLIALADFVIARNH